MGFKVKEVDVLHNERKFGYSISLSKNFNKVSGSHSYPNLTFKGDYIDIEGRATRAVL